MKLSDFYRIVFCMALVVALVTVAGYVTVKPASAQAPTPGRIMYILDAGGNRVPLQDGVTSMPVTGGAAASRIGVTAVLAYTTEGLGLISDCDGTPTQFASTAAQELEIIVEPGEASSLRCDVNASVNDGLGSGIDKGSIKWPVSADANEVFCCGEGGAIQATVRISN